MWDATPYDSLARRVLMAALLRYGLKIEVVSDMHYDRWCRRVRANWDQVNPYRRWQLRFPDELEEAGEDFRITMAVCYGAQEWIEQEKIAKGRVIIEADEWRWSKKHQAHFLYPEEFDLIRKQSFRRKAA